MADPLPAPAALPPAGDKRCALCPCARAEAPQAAEVSAREAADRRALALSKLLRERGTAALDERVQRLLAEVLIAVDDLRLIPDADNMLDRAEYVIGELLSPTPNLILAERLTGQLVGRAGGKLLRMMRKAILLTLPQVAVVVGLIWALLLFGPGGYLLALLADHQLAGQGVVSKLDVAEVIWVGLVGAQGSALSIVVRLGDFNKRHPPMMAFFTGLFKPFIGMCFAQLSYALLKSGLVPLKVPPTPWLCIALGFVAGFSERLAKDLVTIGEQVGMRSHPSTSGRDIRMS